MNINKLRILVLGVGGFIGSNVFVYLLKKKKLNILGVSRSPKSENSKKRLSYLENLYKGKINKYHDLKDLHLIIKKFKPKIIINCVGLIFENNSKKFMYSNSAYPKEIIYLSKNYGLKKFIHFSTIDTYSHFNLDTNKQNHYVKSKLVGDINIKSMCDRHHISYTLLKPSTVYGNFMNNERFVSQIFTGIKTKKKLTIYSNVKKNFVYIENICYLITKELQNLRSKNFYLISKNSFNLIDFIKIISRSLKSDIRYIVLNKNIKNQFNFKFNSFIEIKTKNGIKIKKIQNWERKSLVNSITENYKKNKFSINCI